MLWVHVTAWVNGLFYITNKKKLVGSSPTDFIFPLFSGKSKTN